MGGEALVSRAYSPSIAIDEYRSVSCTHNRLDRQNETFREDVPLLAITEVRNHRSLVNRPAHSMSREVRNNRESMTADFAGYGTADLVYQAANLGGLHGFQERGLDAGPKTACHLRGLTDENRPCGISDVAALLGSDVDLDDVAGFEFARAGNSMYDLIVDTDENRSRKAIHERRSRPGTVSREYLGRDQIELVCCDAWAGLLFQSLEGNSYDPPDRSKASPI